MAEKDETVKSIKRNKSASTQKYLRFSEIHDDLLVLKNGGVRAILKTSSINFNLKSEEEQNGIIYGYQGFLNSLEFPIQILVKSKKLDVDNYIDKIKSAGEKQTNELLQKQTYEYAEYIEKLVEYADIMQKEFYIVVPYNPYRAEKLNIFQKFFQRLNPSDTITEKKRRGGEFEEMSKGVAQRINIVKSGLESCGLKVDQLTTKEIIELLYNCYNPIISRNEKIGDMEEMNIKEDK